ncbi:MAG: hypothetical protein CMO80_17585 [Verrucomicrobiales bacterium]|nr:hypothetical protein [Verrucomicrobiales bacterium]|tara:strand:- start:1024 stop:1917 length:894 start_codon:yes stop_codon:yes gene_type:complete
MNTPRIYGLGTVVVDHKVILDRLPEADTKGEVIDDHFQVGGPVPTALCLLHKLGCDTTFQGRWSKDRFGRMIEDDLGKHGVGYHTPSLRHDSKTGFAHVWVEQSTGRRSVAAFRGSHQVEEREVHAEHLERYDAIHLDGWSTLAAIKAAKIIKRNGGKVFIDLGSPKPHLSQLLENVDHLNCPLRLIHQLFESDDSERGAYELMKFGPQEVTITDGANGATFFDRQGHILHEPAMDVKAVDTNGAGDTFAGAFVFATLQDWSAEKRLRFASIAAALKCAELGNRDALPSLVAIEACL